jgi:predicted aspartyl protease
MSFGEINMPIAYFPSLEEGDALEVVFAKSQGGEVTLRLLVDSGFTGQSSFVLPEDADELAQALAPTAQAAGALQGTQKRIVVSCRVESLSFHLAAIALLADTSRLVLPPGIQGVVGLRFLRYFRRWGAEQSEDGSWRFFLETEK